MDPNLEAEKGIDLLWSEPARSGLRFMALKSSNFILIERVQERSALPLHRVLELGNLVNVATDDSIALVNYDQRVEAIIDLALKPHLLLEDFSTVRAIVLAPALSRRLGAWRRTHQLHDDLWDVEFNVREQGDRNLRVVLVRRVFEPWLAGERISIISRRFVPSKSRNVPADAEWMCALVSRGYTARNPMARTKATDRAGMELSSFASPQAEDLARVLDRTYDELQADQLAERASTGLGFDDSAVADDPVNRAIEIRQRLLRSVRFLAADKWAKWRGVRSNPSAALGKYKRQDRVFAVRDSKQDLYPAFQFDENAEPRAEMSQVLQAVPEGARGWPLLSWFEARNELLNGRKPSDLLAIDPAAVVRAAERFYSRDD